MTTERTQKRKTEQQGTVRQVKCAKCHRTNVTLVKVPILGQREAKYMCALCMGSLTWGR